MASNEKTIEYHTVDVKGTKVNFPFEPYDLQVAYMEKVYLHKKYRTNYYNFNKCISIAV